MKQRKSLAIWLYLLFITSVTNAQVIARTNLRIDEGRYILQLANGRVMEAESNTFNNEGAKVQIWKKQYSLNQLWDFVAADDGKYFIINVASGKALQAGTGEILRNGSMVQLRSKVNSLETQKWFIQGAGTGKYSFRCAAAGSDKVLDVTGGIIDRGGTAIQLWDNTRRVNQAWQLVKSNDSAFVNAFGVDLRRNQSSLKNQAPVSDRGGCTYFGNIAAIEAAYKKRGYGELDISEEFFSIMAKVLYIHPLWSDIRNSNYRENQLGGLQGGGHINWLKKGLKIPTETDVPFKPSFTGPDYWDTRDQRLANDFNNTLLTPAVLKSPIYYGVIGAEQIPASLQRNPSEYERLLSLGYEIDVDLNIAHNYLVVGYDKSVLGSPVFLVKDSYERPGTRCLAECNRVPYATLMGMINDANYITEIREPGNFPALAFLGSWNLNFDGHRGRLDIYHIPGISQPDLVTGSGGSPVADKRIGVFYDLSGNAYRVNGSINGNMLDFYLDTGTPNLRWDKLQGRRFVYFISEDGTFMAGTHKDPDNKKYGGYAKKSSYFNHTEIPANELLHLRNTSWTLMLTNISGTVTFGADASANRISGTFIPAGGRTAPIPLLLQKAGTNGDPLLELSFGTTRSSVYFLNFEKGIICGENISVNGPVILYKK